ncbi:MAG: peptide deformylase [Leptolyngbya sp. DLM2.Bin27]|nr:MAG: peptide deformylase [Leptolyngbya sp. DLM2.Bin27]
MPANDPHDSTSPSPLLTLGHPLLRQVAQPVDAVEDPSVQRLIDRLLLAVQAANGVGIAAPQIGQPVQVVVIASRPNLRYPRAPLMPPTVLVNPRLVAASEDTELGWEGCLSVPGWRGRVPRHRTVEVDYLDRHGRPHRQVWEGFVARIFQHEADHLVGKLFLDHVRSETDRLSETAYQAMEISSLGK